MKKPVEPFDGGGSPGRARPAPLPDPAPHARQRREQEARLQWLRRQQGAGAADDLFEDGSRAVELPLGAGAPPPEPPIGGAVDERAHDDSIVGSGDRMHHLALAPGLAPPAPPWPRGARATAARPDVRRRRSTGGGETL